MPVFQSADIGPRYDFGIATRDGTTLSCLNKDGKVVTVSSLAFMSSIDKSKPQREATELQEKSSLIQFATSNLIDREFDQWPQITQGDWSSGATQRVYGSNGITTQYYDGQGLLWPLNDWQPVQPFAQLPVNAPPGQLAAPIFRGVMGGFLKNAGNGYVTSHAVTNGANWDTHVVFHYADSTADLALVTNSSISVLAMEVAHGSIWVIAASITGGGNITLYQLNWAAGPTLSVVSTTVLQSNLNATGPISSVVTGAVIGNASYVAIALGYQPSAGAFSNSVIVINVSTLANPYTTLTTLGFPSSGALSLVDLNFQGGQLYISMSDGFNATIISSPSPFSTAASIAVVPGLATALLCSVGATVLVVAYSTSPSGVVNRVDLYTLTGGTLIEIGPISAPVSFLLSVSSPVAFGGYAIFSVVFQVQGAASKTVSVYAYDVVRGRLFRALTFTAVGFTGSATIIHGGVAAFGTTTRTYSGGPTYQAQWGIAVYTEAISSGAEMGREFYWGIVPLTPQAFSTLLQQNTDIISGLIDFTAASNKLFRSLAVSFIDGLVLGQTTPSITINVWFDQDPGALAASPDITQSYNGSLYTVLPNQINLPLNRVARKIVYEVITTGAGVIAGNWQNAPKFVSVAIQAATGWVWDAQLDLSPNVVTNSGNPQEYAYEYQSIPGQLSIDAVVAYNFLRLLWRQKGGQCMLTLPNKDSFNALIQALAFESPKPFGASFRADQQSTYQVICTLKIREDI